MAAPPSVVASDQAAGGGRADADPGELAYVAGRVQHELDAFMDVQRSRLAPIGADLVPFLDAVQAYVSGGKRLRAAFCWWGWRAAGGDPADERVLHAAAALEWLQGCALAHDDVVDDSDTRRGAPALHRALSTLHSRQGWRGDADAFGAGTTILLGDLMLSWADEMFRTSGLPPGTVAAAAPYLDACKSEVVAGQLLDLLEQARAGGTVEGAMRVVRYKAAKYTVERPLHLGAALAGAGTDLLAGLSAFGLPVGEAFQLRDDVLGVFGEPSVTGKPAGDDLREGKRTVLLARALEKADGPGRSLLDRLVGVSALKEDDVVRLRAVITESGALQSVEQQIADLSAQARLALDLAPVLDEEARAALSDLAARSIDRHR
jgi:geranylgeranyl diphosphate synthase type I